MSDTGVQIVLCTFPDIDIARQIGTILVEQQLAKCVNLIPSVESIYEWEGEIERGQEVLAVFKTRIACYREFEGALLELHPYKVPEVLAIEVEQGSEDYLRWISK